MQKNETRPYEDTDVPPLDKWKNIPPEVVKISSLIPTQYYLVIDRLMDLRRGGIPEGCDYPLIMVVGTERFIHDGHHRLALAVIQGVTHFHVRMHTHRL